MSEEQLHDLIKQIKHDEKTLRFSTSFTPEDAFQLGIQIRTLFHTVLDRVPHLDGEEEHTKEFGHAIYEGFPPTSSAGIVIHIETFTGHRLFTATAGEASSLKPDNWIWVEGKKNIVRRFHRSSYGIGRDCVAKGKSPEEAGYRLPEYSAYVPLNLRHPNQFTPDGCLTLKGIGYTDTEGVSLYG
ncbi:hypothetical protein FRC17_004990 [Serendipita sp. 399]|nr:hypothetical protein FRC17_004990 [Serendipita sp. 399]